MMLIRMLVSFVAAGLTEWHSSGCSGLHSAQRQGILHWEGYLCETEGENTQVNGLILIL